MFEDFTWQGWRDHLNSTAQVVFLIGTIALIFSKDKPPPFAWSIVTLATFIAAISLVGEGSYDTASTLALADSGASSVVLTQSIAKRRLKNKSED
jgi:hypothetical protein